MKLTDVIEHDSARWALEMAGKTTIPYAAQVLYKKRDEVIKQCVYVEKVSKGRQESIESRVQRQTLNSMARELERGAELLIIGI
tara:strand:+ start:251 stop:502 length:252 start_codon:yes stop_codon:yes gene_type:complete